MDELTGGLIDRQTPRQTDRKVTTKSLHNTDQGDKINKLTSDVRVHKN